MQTPLTASRNYLADPAVVTIVVGVLIGVISGFWRSLMLGWLFGLLVGVIHSVKQTRETPEHLKRSRFVQLVGSGRFGSPFVHDRRIFDTVLTLWQRGRLARVNRPGGVRAQ
jgi:hypothetical protein